MPLLFLDPKSDLKSDLKSRQQALTLISWTMLVSLATSFSTGRVVSSSYSGKIRAIRIMNAEK